MRISTSKADPKTGSIDDADGGIVPIDDEDLIPVEDDGDALAVLDDEDDANPGDRRRDPLRRP